MERVNVMCSNEVWMRGLCEELGIVYMNALQRQVDGLRIPHTAFRRVPRKAGWLGRLLFQLGLAYKMEKWSPYDKFMKRAQEVSFVGLRDEEWEEVLDGADGAIRG